MTFGAVAARWLATAGLPDYGIQLRLGHAHPGEIRWYRPDPGDGQATRDAIDTALTAAGTGPEQAAAC